MDVFNERSHAPRPIVSLAARYIGFIIHSAFEVTGDCLGKYHADLMLFE